MQLLKRILSCFLFLLLFNAYLLISLIPFTPAFLLILMLLAYYFYKNIGISFRSTQLGRLGALGIGYELALAAVLCSSLEILVYSGIFLFRLPFSLLVLVINAIGCFFLGFVMMCNGVIRIIICSRQLSILIRILMLLLWWVPILNFVLLGYFLLLASEEYEYAIDRQQLNMDRQRDQLCSTKYPLLMVHGFGFRDWENFNYWGRIPDELKDNGAQIHYGGQQSSAPLEQCAQELRQRLTDIMAQTGCEKVNIIAHSKGGLDSRYMISCLSMGSHVASLTTINTPHRGCSYIPHILKKIPKRTVAFVDNRYRDIFTKLGDSAPDLLGGLQDLTDIQCRRLNKLMRDDERVVYQSVGSRMRSARSGYFPHNVGYSVIRRYGGGDNDGVVATQSMEWGNFLGIISPKGRHGICHGDMIDLTRSNIEGFDVCEFYIDLVHKLKLRGL